MSVHEIEKEKFSVDLPVELTVEIRTLANRERMTYYEKTTELLCKALGWNPSRFGIEPDTATAHAASA